jgi:hypothetical protein
LRAGPWPSLHHSNDPWSVSVPRRPSRNFCRQGKASGPTDFPGPIAAPAPNAKIYVANVRDGFIAADPKDKALFETVPQGLNFSEKVQDP